MNFILSTHALQAPPPKRGAKILVQSTPSSKAVHSLKRGILVRPPPALRATSSKGGQFLFCIPLEGVPVGGGWIKFQLYSFLFTSQEGNLKT